MDYPRNPAPADHPILPAIVERWSPLAFSDRPVEPEKIATFFEAARWAASSYNEQPWRYIYASKKHEHRPALEDLLLPGNSWAAHAGVLVIGFAKKTFTRNSAENRHALYDLGSATGFLVLQLPSLGLIGHQMAGFHADLANTALHVPEDYVPGSMIAIGYPAERSTLPVDLQVREEAPRARNPINAFAFEGVWNA